MFAFRRFVEWYLGLPPAGSGEGTRWRFTFEPPFALSATAAILLTAVMLALIICVALRSAGLLPFRRRLLLAILRAAALLIVFAGLFRLSLSIDRTQLPWLALLVDRSASMAREDVSETGRARSSRLQEVQNWLGRDENNPIERLRRSYRIRLFEFAAEPHELDSGAGPFDLEMLRGLLRELRPDGERTRLASTLRSVLHDFRGAPPAAVLVFTDGASSEGPAERLSAAADDARVQAVPVWTVGLGSEAAIVDLALVEVHSDAAALVDETLAFDVQIHSQGVPAGSGELRLLSPEGELLDSVTVPVGPSVAGAATLHHRPLQEGEWNYVVEVAPRPDEVDQENNRRAVSVQVRSQRLKVLYVERRPRWEFRHLKASLERDAAVELKTVLLDADLDYVREDRTALAQPPTSLEELLEYDVIILGDVAPSDLSPQFSAGVEQLVSEESGGLILISGPRFQPQTWGVPPWTSLLPVQVNGLVSPPETEGRVPVPSTAGRDHALLRLEATEPLEFPPLNWWAVVGPLKAGAVSLLELPAAGSGPAPVIVTQRYGAGNVLWHATDELWKWRRLREDALYGRYWSQAVRWVSRGRLAGDPRAGELRTNRRSYPPGEPVHLELLVSDRAPIVASDPPRVEVRGTAGGIEELTLSRDGAAEQRFRGTLTDLPPAEYVARWVNPPQGGAEIETRFQIETLSMERPGAALDREDLAKTAELTHGRYLQWSGIDDVFRELPPGRPILTSEAIVTPLWSRWELGLLLCGLICVEWFVRRRWRLV